MNEEHRLTHPYEFNLAHCLSMLMPPRSPGASPLPNELLRYFAQKADEAETALAHMRMGIVQGRGKIFHQ